jgi:hypothetical protein
MSQQTQTPTEEGSTANGGNTPFPVASWDIFYLTEEGFEAHLKLSGESGQEVLEKAKAATKKIAEQGGQPRPARGVSLNGKDNGESHIDKETMTYVDKDGVRRCARMKKDGSRCEAKVGARREGKYGPFYPCPSYKEHKPK